MLLTETWLRPAGDEAKIADLAPPEYSVLSFPRSVQCVSHSEHRFPAPSSKLCQI